MAEAGALRPSASHPWPLQMLVKQNFWLNHMVLVERKETAK